MTFLYPLFLWLIVPLFLLLWHNKSGFIVRIHLILLILLFLSLSRPVQEKSLQLSNMKAKDIIIALDVSYSMQATDVFPNRYAFAKKTIKAFLAQNPRTNVMLIAFTTNPLLLSPPTTDHTLINIALQSLNPEYILTKGTSLQALFKKLHTWELGEKNLILMTDGGDEKNIKTLIPYVEKSKLSLTVLAMGSKVGTTLKTKKGSLLKDENNNLVVSRINPLLEALVTATHGSYLTASTSAESTAKVLSSTISKQQNKQIQKMQHHYKEWYPFPLGLAIFLFLFVHTRGIKYLIVLFTFIGVHTQASVLDDYRLYHAYALYTKKEYKKSEQLLQKITHASLQSTWALANNYYKQGKYKKAIDTYKALRSSSVSIKQGIYYNIANAYSKLASYDKAKIYYTKALQLGKDNDARYNLARIALLHNKKDASLGIAHPKSQGANTHKSKNQDTPDKNQEDKPSSGSGSGGKQHNKSEKKKIQLMQDKNKQKQPLSSKVYDLINKGYIRETQPW